MIEPLPDADGIASVKNCTVCVDLQDGRALVTDFGVARVAEHRYFEHEMTQGPGTEVSLKRHALCSQSGQSREAAAESGGRGAMRFKPLENDAWEGYIAPEQRTAAYDRPADVWAFGVIAARLLGLQNWKELSDPKHRLALHNFPIKDSFLVNLALACLETDPRMRPTFEQIVNRSVSELIRLELERALRTEYRNVFPLQQRDLCCCRFHDQHQQQQQQQRQEGGAASGSLEGGISSPALLPAPLWHYRAATAGGAPGASVPPLAISLSACSSPRNVAAGVTSEDLTLEVPLVDIPGGLSDPLVTASSAAVFRTGQGGPTQKAGAPSTKVGTALKPPPADREMHSPLFQ
ncbi:serine/threonine-protein kinase TAO1-like [Cyclospora cayetanensis]|uniref:Serine/threonine-protein kinase TAO1-like n=1 Tax=Cyclospora cayetanensis TaxID=88456 RepID=A0A6P6RTG7_9EIME|nr:serine/threonine-protein kinase TAO1-like [Cyclospora cayetanensis]